jgi:alpha-ketoglutarate-dependent taurine dioxygenase
VAHCYEGRTDGSMPTVHQPLVRVHPVTGRKALYGAAGTCLAIDGLDDAESKALLGELGRHAVDARFQYVHQYAKDDLVIWDNASTLHRGPTLEEARGEGEARVMHRCSVRGWPEVA